MPSMHCSVALVLFALALLPAVCLAEEPVAGPVITRSVTTTLQNKGTSKKIVLIAGKKSHGPGAHDYERTMRLFKVMLDNSNVADSVRVEVHENGWPTDGATLDDADTIVFDSDGRDGDLFTDVPFVLGDRPKKLQQQIDRGCGLMTMHFSTFVDDKQGEQVMDWVGGYFDWQDDVGQRNWFSKISQIETLEIAARDHPVARGVPRMVQLRDEVYWNLRFRPDDKRITPLWRALNVKLDDPSPNFNTVAWATERADGGRGFGTSVGHSYRLWQDEGVRTLFLNAIAWTAHVEIPTEGVQASFYTDAQVAEALANVRGTQPAVIEPPIRVLLFTGNKAHAWHNGPASTPAVVAALQADRRVQVEVSEDSNDLATRDLSKISTIALNNYCNWHDPAGISEPARTALLAYLKRGGGLVVVHFANGAFHPSLPEAAASDWPEYRQIVRRVWDHHGQGESKSGHDAFGKFTVNIKQNENPLVAGLKPFEVTDELYFRQAGDQPIEPLISAHSKVTKRNEPLAWTYKYHDARVFQTLLGHSEKTYDTFEAREMLRRAVAWTADRKIVPLTQENESLTASEAPPALIAGRFGKALDAKTRGLLLNTRSENLAIPLTVQCWAKLDSKQGFNILVAGEEKSAATHWELYSYAGSGVCSVYLPGRGGEFKSEMDICDGAWHHVGFSLTEERVRIFVDGQRVLEKPCTKAEDKPASGTIGVGRLVEGTVGCDGAIDDLCISRGELALTSLPDKAQVKNDATLLLVSFDNIEELKPVDVKKSAAREPTNAAVPKPPVSGSRGNHWGMEGIGFNWKEEDSLDDRWQQSEIGPFLASSLPLGSAAGTVAKALSIRVGDQQQGTVCYDTAHLKLRAAWLGGFLKFKPNRYGLIMPPLMAGEPQFLAKESPGWVAKSLQLQGFHQHGERLSLEYNVDGISVKETPWLDVANDQAIFVRNLTVAPCEQPRVMRLAEKLATDDSVSLGNVRKQAVGIWQSGQQRVLFFSSSKEAKLRLSDDQQLQLEIAPHAENIQIPLLFGSFQTDDAFSKALDHVAGASFQKQIGFPKAYEPNWTKEIVTSGERAVDDGPYVVDTIALPFENPYKALFFVSGHDTFSHDAKTGNSSLALCTVHGDVWIVSGVNASLEKLTWRRYATGLFQPLGLVRKNDELYVLGRDQITRLRDTNHDGEADHYECFTNQFPTSPGGHDYTTCLETDEAGNFYFLTANEGIWRLSPDGQQLTNLAGGLRNPNGLGVGPGPIITAAPQEGNWTPASYIAEAKQGDYFGYGGPKITRDRPLGWTQPLCFLPRRRDNSSGGQVWVTDDRWGPLRDHMLHFSYGQCRMLLVLREVVAGQVQGGTVDMSPRFDSGAMRGRFSPYDGQLYVSGLRGWTTSATQDGCLQRVRYTGRAANMPIKFGTLQNGVSITFTDPLDRKSAQNVGNFHLEQWNYRYAESYGSPDFKVSQPKQEGHDEVRLESATLLDDNRTVFLEINELKPVNQLTIGYALVSEAGAELRRTIAYTIHKVGGERLDPATLHREKVPGRLSADEEAALRPGLVGQISRDGKPAESYVSRMATLHFNEPRFTNVREEHPLTLSLTGYLHVPLRNERSFALEGNGKVALFINDREVLRDEGKLSSRSEAVQLHSGCNKIRVEFTSSDFLGEMALRLLWRSEADCWEPVSPAFLFHNSNEETLQASLKLSQGEQIFNDRLCMNCHRNNRGPESIRQAPAIDGLAGRINPHWLVHWLLDPRRLRSHADMPRLFDADKAADRQASIDIVAWLTSSENRDDRPQADPPPDGRVEEQLRGEGRVLYERLGCIACHTLASPEKTDEFNRVSLHYAHAKFPPGELYAYLREPHRHHATSRMPDFKLSSAEARALAAYLDAMGSGPLEPIADIATGNVGNGQKQFVERRCNACHPRQESDVIKPVAIDARNFNRGCATNDPNRRGKAPTVDWSSDELTAIQTYLAAGMSSQTSLPVRVSQSLYRELRCNACHNRDGRTADRMAILADESDGGLTPEPLPDLTWAGEKLHSGWTKAQLEGKLTERTRPWLTARMPAFPAYAEALASGLEAEHGISSGHGGNPTNELATAKIGEQLTLKENLDCRQCHSIGSLEPTGDEKTKLAPGINFALVGDRLRYEYYRNFTLDPPRWDISTRMPKLAVDGRTTKVTQYLDGDAELQFAAIWNYLQTVKKPPTK